MTTLTQTPATKGQIRQITRVGTEAIELVLEELGLDKEGAQRVHAHGDEFAASIREVAITSLKDLSVSNRYADEEVQSNYKYPKEYNGPNPILEQIERIAKIFGLDPQSAYAFAKNLPDLPNGAEGWFAIPSVEALARVHFPEVTDQGEMCCRAVELVLEKISELRKFYNYREGQITSNRFRRHAHTVRAMEQIREVQSGDILVIAAQLGMTHRGRSVRRARELFVSTEFGLGSLEVGSVVLTHPERLVRYEELDMDCAGDEFAPDADGVVSYAPLFRFNDGRVKFSASWLDDAGGYYGSASGFVPQSES